MGSAQLMKGALSELAGRLDRFWFHARERLPGQALRSAYGPRLVKRRGDYTYYLCIKAVYGKLISDSLVNHPRPYVFFDIGANAGVFSLIAAQSEKCVGAVAFEPVPYTFASLVRNIEINGAKRVVPICSALTGEQSSLVTLSYNRQHSGTSRIRKGQSYTPTAVLAPTAGHEMLNELFDLWSAEEAIVKIDVEGAELEALSVLRKTSFYASVAELFIEISARNQGRGQVDEIYQLLSQDGFIEQGRSDTGRHYDARFVRQHAQG